MRHRRRASPASCRSRSLPTTRQSGLLYAFYNAREGAYGDIRISEFRRRRDDPDVVDSASERVLLTIPKPYENHNGGMLQFGPDGYLYASVGDGDPGVLHPAGFFAQRLDSLLGSILRIDPRGGDPYAVPRRQPVRRLTGSASGDLGVRPSQPVALLDRQPTRTLVVARTSEARQREEINVVAPGRPASTSAGRVSRARWSSTRPRRARIRSRPIWTGPADGRLRRHRRRRHPRHRASPRSSVGTSTETSAPGRSPPRRSRTLASPRPTSSTSRAGTHELRGGRGRAGLRDVGGRRGLPARSGAVRDLSSASQAAARRPSQIGVSST